MKNDILTAEAEQPKTELEILFGSQMPEPRNAFIERSVLARAEMSPEDAEAFRREATMGTMRDCQTAASVVYYIHPDGRVLIDAIRVH